MPAPIKRYYNRMEVQQILGISKGKAHEIMKMFEMRGQLFMDGKTRRVRVEVFENWLREKEKGGTRANA
ncbi:MAG: hypothetical protein ACOYJ1_00935 [Peptococcales bacterium]|jgi:hypothetical protein